jgi:hypothetical protein
VDSLKDSVKNQKYDHDQHVARMREVQDSVQKLENVQVPAINARLNHVATQEETNKVRHDMEEKVYLSVYYKIMHYSTCLKLWK